jgi:hypothetical protein
MPIPVIALSSRQVQRIVSPPSIFTLSKASLSGALWTQRSMSSLILLSCRGPRNARGATRRNEDNIEFHDAFPSMSYGRPRHRENLKADEGA